MKNQTKLVSTLVNPQDGELDSKVEGFCGKNYTSGESGVSCGSGYSSNGSGVGSTSEELDILI